MIFVSVSGTCLMVTAIFTSFLPPRSIFLIRSPPAMKVEKSNGFGPLVGRTLLNPSAARAHAVRERGRRSCRQNRRSCSARTGPAGGGPRSERSRDRDRDRDL